LHEGKRLVGKTIDFSSLLSEGKVFWWIVRLGGRSGGGGSTKMKTYVSMNVGNRGECSLKKGYNKVECVVGRYILDG